MNGLKTYIGSIAIGLAGVALYLGWISTEQFALAGTIIAGFTGVSMRHAVKKTERAAKVAATDATADLEEMVEDIARKVSHRLKSDVLTKNM